MSRRSSEFLVLAIDLGSSSTRTALFDDSGRCLRGATAHRQYSVRYTTEGGAELGAMTLRRAAAACLKETLSVYRGPRGEKRIPIRALTGCAFWHSLLALDRKRQPITPIFTWADSRSMPDARLLRSELSEREIHARTGCMLRASFWPAKLRWLRRTQPTLFRRAVHWVSPAQWIFSELFGVRACSHSMASATGMYDLRGRTWDLALCHACGISPAQLGAISDECEANARFPRQLRPAKIFTAIGDGAASNIGCGADRPGFVAINLGTSAAVRMIQWNDQAGAGELP
ncbi:MAG: FGGY family carbohydrate kinase, partial [Chthoniobacterales bacterium]